MSDSSLYIFTICSNNYLAQALVLGKSIKKYNPSTSFKIFLCDVKNSKIDYGSLDYDIIEIASIESNIVQMAQKYNIVELNTAVKPAVFEYLFEFEDIEKAIYLDPDIYVFDSLETIGYDLNVNSILFTPHIITPINLDHRTPDENLFLNFGIFNLGFLALKNDSDSKKLLNWWKNHTYENGFIKPSEGIFVDQLPMNLATIFFDNVKVLKNLGYNMAPWNLHERYLSKVNGRFIVNNHEKLVFYHFSSFTVNNRILPKWLTRFLIEDRQDLIEIYDLYNAEVVDAGYLTFSTFKSSYSIIYEETLEANRKLKWQHLSIQKKAISILKNIIPQSLKNSLK